MVSVIGWWVEKLELNIPFGLGFDKCFYRVMIYYEKSPTIFSIMAMDTMIMIMRTTKITTFVITIVTKLMTMTMIGFYKKK